MRELVGRSVAETRRKLGLTQDQVAARFRQHGLRSWGRGTVGQLEAGLRNPGLAELLLMAHALRIGICDLFPDRDDELVEIGEGAEVSPRWIREMITGDLWTKYVGQPSTEHPREQLPLEAYTGDVQLAAEAQRRRALLAPTFGWAASRGIEWTREDWDAVWSPVTEAERHAATRLGVKPAQVKFSARLLWDHRDFDDERDRRIGDIDQLEPRSRQARRGLVTRQMLTELRALLDEISGQQS